MLFTNLRFLGLVAIAGLAVACVVGNDPPETRPYSPGAAYPSGGDAGASGSSGSSGAATNGSPILVEVDTGKTMNAAPGQGVGVFVEYVAGGHWHVWWTCDTNVNPQGALTCDFAIRTTVTQGSIALTNTTAPSGSVKSVSPQELDANTTTGAELHGVNFDTTAGTTITIDAAIAGQHDGRYFFFVQDGQVNGGFTGTLTDPLMLQGSTP